MTGTQPGTQPGTPPRPQRRGGLANGPLDATTKWAVGVAGTVSTLLSLLMGVDLLLHGAQYSICSPDYTCGGLPSHDVYAGWLIGAIGYSGSLSVVVLLNGRGQRALRWLCACAAVACPVVIMLVAAKLSQPPL